MFNTLLKKASESSFAALAGEALDPRPGSPAAPRRQPGSSQAGQHSGAGNPARKACSLWLRLPTLCIATPASGVT